MQRRHIFLIVAYGWVVSSVEATIFAPCLEEMMHFFAVSAQKIQGVIFYYFLGMVVLSLFYGYMSEVVGRRKVLVFAAFGLVLSSILCAFTGNFLVFIWARFLQGCFAAAPYCLGISLIYDVYERKEAPIYMSYMTAIYSLCMAGGPVLGAFLLQLYGWQANLWAIVAINFFYFLYVSLFLPSTNRARGFQKNLVFNFLSEYMLIFRNLQIISSSYCIAIYIAILNLMIVQLTLIHVTVWNLEGNVSSYVLFVLLFVTLIARLPARWLMTRFSPIHLSLLGLVFSLAALLLFYLFSMTTAPFFLTTIAAILFVFISTATFPGLIDLINTVYPDKQGMVGAVYTFIRLTLSFATLKLGAFLYNHTFERIAFYYFLLCLSAAGLFLLYLARKSSASSDF